MRDSGILHKSASVNMGETVHTHSPVNTPNVRLNRVVTALLIRY